MTQAKGKHGGPRINAGGARPGAGRPRKPVEAKTPPAPAEQPEKQEEGEQEPLAYLLKVLNDPNEDPKLRVRAAIAAAQYRHTKRSDGGKKDEAEQAAKKASSGRFGRATPPKLVVSNS